MKTLLIIDVQNDFIPGGSLAVPDGNKIIPVINRILGRFDLVVATQDWHPADHISFASSHKGRKPFEVVDTGGTRQVLWPDHCVQGSSGADFCPGLNMNHTEAIFRKGMDREIDSYSAFYDNGHLKSTGLAGYLHERKSDELFFCGLAADVCVWYSIRDAVREGFNTTLIEDATSPIDYSSFKRIKSEITHSGSKIVKSRELIS